MRDRVSAALRDPDANGPGIDVAAVVDVVVRDEVAARFGHVGLRLIGLADPHTTRAEIVNMVLHDPVFLAAAAQPDAVRADVGNLALFDGEWRAPEAETTAGTVTAACGSP